MFIIVLVCLSSIVFASSVTENQIDAYLNTCLKAEYHRSKPGPATEPFPYCSPWQNHSCCTANTTKEILHGGPYELYHMDWNQCGRPLSAQCRRFIEMDTCFYECSPNLKPWIQVDPDSDQTIRREMFVNLPLCSSDCDDWFEACKDDLLCSDNFRDLIISESNPHECKKPCKTFKDYYGDPVTFCNRLFNYSFKYTKGKPGEDCFTLWPNGTNSNANVKVARKYARKALSTSSSGLRIAVNVVVVLFSCVIGVHA